MIHTLVSNAAKYTPSGGKLALSVLREADAGVLRVSDSGVGIVPELLPHVFDLAPIGTHPADRSHGGLGLGLALGGASSTCTAAASAPKVRGAIAAASSACACRWPRFPAETHGPALADQARWRPV